MREILFSGKRKDNGEWVIGDSLVHSMYKKGDVCIGVIEGLEIYSVIPETVSQYTGLVDICETKIFEGDVVQYKDCEYGKIVYDEDSAMFIVMFDTWCTNFDSIYPYELEVIGNIHDNPELLGGGEK